MSTTIDAYLALEHSLCRKPGPRHRDLKKGTTTVGVQRQRTETAERIENAQVTAYLAYASDRGNAFIDWALSFFRTHAPDPVPLSAPARLTGRRWAVDCSSPPSPDNPDHRPRRALVTVTSPSQHLHNPPSPTKRPAHMIAKVRLQH
ncbi:hypothetical protein FMEAI12_3350025 [Parafrankia sp. Ea1.12]|nr:hypothetical protein FMEAI12_3350025 [Parafrankia sp. Ea1.12]